MKIQLLTLLEDSKFAEAFYKLVTSVKQRSGINVSWRHDPEYVTTIANTFAKYKMPIEVRSYKIFVGDKQYNLPCCITYKTNSKLAGLITAIEATGSHKEETSQKFVEKLKNENFSYEFIPVDAPITETIEVTETDKPCIENIFDNAPVMGGLMQLAEEFLCMVIKPLLPRGYNVANVKEFIVENIIKDSETTQWVNYIRHHPIFEQRIKELTEKLIPELFEAAATCEVSESHELADASEAVAIAICWAIQFDPELSEPIKQALIDYRLDNPDEYGEYDTEEEWADELDFEDGFHNDCLRAIPSLSILETIAILMNHVTDEDRPCKMKMFSSSQWIVTGASGLCKEESFYNNIIRMRPLDVDEEFPSIGKYLDSIPFVQEGQTLNYAYSPCSDKRIDAYSYFSQNAENIDNIIVRERIASIYTIINNHISFNQNAIIALSDLHKVWSYIQKILEKTLDMRVIFSRDCSIAIDNRWLSDEGIQWEHDTSTGCANQRQEKAFTYLLNKLTEYHYDKSVKSQMNLPTRFTRLGGFCEVRAQLLLVKNEFDTPDESPLVKMLETSEKITLVQGGKPQFFNYTGSFESAIQPAPISEVIGTENMLWDHFVEYGLSPNEQDYNTSSSRRHFNYGSARKISDKDMFNELYKNEKTVYQNRLDFEKDTTKALNELVKAFINRGIDPSKFITTVEGKEKLMGTVHENMIRDENFFSTEKLITHIYSSAPSFYGIGEAPMGYESDYGSFRPSPRELTHILLMSQAGHRRFYPDRHNTSESNLASNKSIIIATNIDYEVYSDMLLSDDFTGDEARDYVTMLQEAVVRFIQGSKCTEVDLLAAARDNSRNSHRLATTALAKQIFTGYLDEAAWLKFINVTPIGYPSFTNVSRSENVVVRAEKDSFGRLVLILTVDYKLARNATFAKGIQYGLMTLYPNELSLLNDACKIEISPEFKTCNVPNNVTPFRNRSNYLATLKHILTHKPGLLPKVTAESPYLTSESEKIKEFYKECSQRTFGKFRPVYTKVCTDYVTSTGTSGLFKNSEPNSIVAWDKTLITRLRMEEDGLPPKEIFPR